MAKASISIAKGKGSIPHNNRTFVAENVEESRTKDNIIYKQETLEDAYKNCFESAIETYNAKQKRADRRIGGVKGYMEQIRNSKNGEKLFYENVVQVGNMQDSHVGTERGETCKEILDTYMRGFQERNPNLYVFNAVMHLDEQTPHLHIDYIPLATEYKQGLSVRNSLDRALKQQGVEGKANKYENRTIAWQNSEKDHIEGIMKERGLERTSDRGLHQEHKSVEYYKTVISDIHNEVKEIPKQIEATPKLFNKQKVVVNVAELSELEERAKLSLLHEQASKKLVSELQNNRQHKEIEYYKGLCKKYVGMFNKSQKQLKTTYENLKEQKQVNAQLQAENRSLKAQISDLKRSFDEKVQLAVEKAIAPLREQINTLKAKIKKLEPKHNRGMER